jgi:hypothetical protein
MDPPGYRHVGVERYLGLFVAYKFDLASQQLKRCSGISEHLLLGKVLVP